MRHPPEVVIANAAAKQMHEEAEAKFPLETGGILIGSTSAGKVVVELAIGPGPRARHGVASFSRDGEYAQQELERIADQSRGGLDYIGEWHSHTLPVGPSPQDRKSMAFIASSPAYGLSEPLLILCLPKPLFRKRAWTLRCYSFSSGKLVESGGEPRS